MTQHYHEDAAPRGLDCFLSAERPCDATCVAYSPTNDPDFKDKSWGSCVVLVTAAQLRKSASAIARTLTNQPPVVPR